MGKVSGINLSIFSSFHLSIFCIINTIQLGNINLIIALESQEVERYQSWLEGVKNKKEKKGN